MTQWWSRRAFLGVLATTTGCVSGGGHSTPTTLGQSTTETERRTGTESSEGPPSATSAQATTEPVEVRTWPEDYYQGPLVSAHEHVTGRGFSEREEGIEWFVRWMDRNKVDQVIAFAPDGFMDLLVEYDDRFLPFAFGYREMREDYDDLTGAFEPRLEEWPYVGIGELGFKGQVTPPGEPPPQPDDPQALELWDLAAERDIPVMVHASEPWRYPDGMRDGWDEYSDCPTKASLANAMAHNRDTQFLVHATYQWHDTPNGELVADALDNNPNLTYDVSMLHPLGYGDGPLTEEEFTGGIEEMGGVERIVERFYEEYQVILEEYSHRLTWGMDAAWEWHYTDWALNTWADSGRALLGMLPEENARNIGYRTVSDLMDIEVQTS